MYEKYDLIISKLKPITTPGLPFHFISKMIGLFKRLQFIEFLHTNRVKNPKNSIRKKFHSRNNKIRMPFQVGY